MQITCFQANKLAIIDKLLKSITAHPVFLHVAILDCVRKLSNDKQQTTLLNSMSTDVNVAATRFGSPFRVICQLHSSIKITQFVSVRSIYLRPVVIKFLQVTSNSVDTSFLMEYDTKRIGKRQPLNCAFTVVRRGGGGGGVSGTTFIHLWYNAFGDRTHTRNVGSTTRLEGRFK